MDGARAKSGEIALIGFGEAAEAFRIGWGRSVSRARAFDVELLDPDQAARMAERCRAAGVECCDSPEQALADAGLVLCLITADQALAAAKAAAPHLFTGTLWLDGNSCSPGTKRAAAAVIETGGGLYVDMAIMAPVYPRRHKTPVLLAGPAAEPAAAALRRLGMAPEVAGLAVGEASMIKMLRSVMVKGMEALTAECFLAARRAGVDAAVLRSLQSSDPSFDWKTRAAYNLERMIVHGGRRAAEMREVAATLRELGFPDRMAAATAVWQDEIGALSLADGAADLAERADRILDRLP